MTTTIEPAVHACLRFAAHKANLTDTQIAAVYAAALADSYTRSDTATVEQFRQAITRFETELSEDPSSASAEIANKLREAAANPPSAGKIRAAALACDDRALLAAAHIEGLLDRFSSAAGESFEHAVVRYHAHRARAELNPAFTAPHGFTVSLASATNSWAVPGDRVTMWALYRVMRDDRSTLMPAVPLDAETGPTH